MKLWKTTLVVLTDYDPSNASPLHLIYESDNGDNYLYSKTIKTINSNTLNGQVELFFGGLNERGF